MPPGERLLRWSTGYCRADGSAQCDISTGTVMCSSSSRLTPAEQGFAQLRVMVAAADDQVGAEIGGAREQNVGDGEATAQGLLEPRRDPMVAQVIDHPVECRAVLLEVALMGSDQKPPSLQDR